MNAQAYDHAVIVTGAYREPGKENGKAYTLGVGASRIPGFRNMGA